MLTAVIAKYQGLEAIENFNDYRGVRADRYNCRVIAEIFIRFFAAQML